MLDPEFVSEEYGEDYLEQRTQFLKLKTINEFSMNLGIRYRAYFSTKLHGLISISVGPSIHDKGTERVAKGFAFSDVGTLGLIWLHQNFSIFLGTSVRHVSNANLKFPNSGHNSTNFELGIIFPIKEHIENNETNP